MKKLALLTLAAVTVGTLSGCVEDTYGGGDPGPWGYYDRGYYHQYGRYDYNSPDPRYHAYYADKYYREDPRYHEYTLSRNDRVYRGENGQYYCRRSDGTTGAIVGGIAGGVLGNIIAPGGSEVLGTVLGAAGGAAAGAAIDQNSSVHCR